ncbi:NPCBM/NEW2 domain-containing protein [Streptomyces sp. 2RAF24]
MLPQVAHGVGVGVRQACRARRGADALGGLRKAASTGVLTNDAPAQPLKADITGARTVHLVVTDGGDGIGYDHADWADAKLSC